MSPLLSVLTLADEHDGQYLQFSIGCCCILKYPGRWKIYTNRSVTFLVKSISFESAFCPMIIYCLGSICCWPF